MSLFNTASMTGVNFKPQQFPLAFSWRNSIVHSWKGAENITTSILFQSIPPKANQLSTCNVIFHLMTFVDKKRFKSFAKQWPMTMSVPFGEMILPSLMLMLFFLVVAKESQFFSWTPETFESCDEIHLIPMGGLHQVCIWKSALHPHGRCCVSEFIQILQQCTNPPTVKVLSPARNHNTKNFIIKNDIFAQEFGEKIQWKALEKELEKKTKKCHQIHLILPTSLKRDNPSDLFKLLDTQGGNACPGLVQKLDIHVPE